MGLHLGSTPQKDNILVLCSCFWSDPTVATQVHSALEGFIKAVDVAAAKEGVAQNFRYTNYAAAGFQDPLKSNGVKGLLRLVAAKYDPRGMFQKQVVGGWKLYK
jgi:hypothetical protein